MQLKIVYNVGMCLMSAWMFRGCLHALQKNWARALLWGTEALPRPRSRLPQMGPLTTRGAGFLFSAQL
jgi:hypothetical protein